MSCISMENSSRSATGLVRSEIKVWLSAVTMADFAISISRRELLATENMPIQTWLSANTLDQFIYCIEANNMDMKTSPRKIEDPLALRAGRTSCEIR